MARNVECDISVLLRGDPARAGAVATPTPEAAAYCARPRFERRQPRPRAGCHLRLVEARSNEFHRQRKASRPDRDRSVRVSSPSLESTRRPACRPPRTASATRRLTRQSPAARPSPNRSSRSAPDRRRQTDPRSPRHEARDRSSRGSIPEYHPMVSIAAATAGAQAWKRDRLLSGSTMWYTSEEYRRAICCSASACAFSSSPDSVVLSDSSASGRSSTAPRSIPCCSHHAFINAAARVKFASM